MKDAEYLYKMLWPMYEPIEKALLKPMSEEHRKQYKAFPAEKKIQWLDYVAKKRGL